MAKHGLWQELRAGSGRHDGDVYRAVLFHRGNVGLAAARRRRLFICTRAGGNRRAGALVAVVVSLATLATLFRNADYNKGVLGAPAWFVLGIAYYAFYAQERLVLAPEEQSAFAHRIEKPAEKPPALTWGKELR